MKGGSEDGTVKEERTDEVKYIRQLTKKRLASYMVLPLVSSYLLHNLLHSC